MKQYRKLDAYWLMGDGLYHYWVSSTQFKTCREFREYAKTLHPDKTFKVARGE